MVSKSHPRIFLRGRLDTLIAETVLTQTSLAAASRIPDAIKNGLADINAWLWQILQAEVSGSPVPEQTMCGMNAAVLREVARDPQTYLIPRSDRAWLCSTGCGRAFGKWKLRRCR